MPLLVLGQGQHFDTAFPPAIKPAAVKPELLASDATHVWARRATFVRRDESFKHEIFLKTEPYLNAAAVVNFWP